MLHQGVVTPVIAPWCILRCRRFRPGGSARSAHKPTQVGRYI